MPRLSSILQPDVVSYTARLGPESVTVMFDRARMTGRWEREVGNSVASNDQDKLVDLLFGVFVSWDVVDDDNRPVAMSPEILLGLPNTALINLLEGMQEAAVPSRAEGNATPPSVSEPSEVSEANSQSSPNGSDGSQSRTVSASPSLT